MNHSKEDEEAHINSGRCSISKVFLKYESKKLWNEMTDVLLNNCSNFTCENSSLGFFLEAMIMTDNAAR